MSSTATSNTNNGNTFMVGTNTVIVLNTQHSLKLTNTNYPAWHVQMNALFIGYDLSGFIDGTKPCPVETDPNFSYWRRQDQLILHAIIISVDPSIITALGTVKTSQQAWETLKKMFASKTRARIMHLKERLSRFNKGTNTIPVYLQGIKAIADELALINSPLDDVDLVIHTLNGLGSEYREITTALRTRENPISFEDLHDILSDFENYLKREEIINENTSLPPIATANAAFKGKPYNKNRGPQNQKSFRPTSPTSSYRDICQYCDKPGHTAKICYNLHGYPKRPNKPTAHHARTTSRQPPQEWIMDSGATHHITNALDNLHFNNQYHGSDELLVGDGSGLPIMHTGKTSLKTSSQPLKLPHVLHVPQISKNLLSISSLCQTNPISVEFFSDYFLVKDLKTRAPLIKGHHKEGLYILHQPSTTPAAYLTTSITRPWHHILGHPSARILRQFPFIQQIKQKDQHPCISCNIVKSHKLPFSTSSLCSKQPLELLYTDVWGPSPNKSIDGYSYYLIIVDHFTKYIWFYPLKFKSDVSIIFPKFKSLVEKFFNLPIITLYSDNGGEFIKLKQFLTTHGISHYTTPPHTPELNATAERRHRHIVETGKALLHTAKLPPSFWSFAFRTAVYLINRLPTPLLNMKSPIQILHHTKPNLLHLHSFGCLCFPWLRPYTSNKLQPRSQPCIFIGYADTQYAYHCLDPITHKIYTSRHVKFYDHIFPYTSLTAKPSPPSTQDIVTNEPMHTIIPIHSSIHQLPMIHPSTPQPVTDEEGPTASAPR
jgi:hypothetical protein